MIFYLNVDRSGRETTSLLLIFGTDNAFCFGIWYALKKYFVLYDSFQNLTCGTFTNYRLLKQKN